MNYGDTGMLLDVRLGFFDFEIVGTIGEPLKHGESGGLDRPRDCGGLLRVGDENDLGQLVFDLRRQIQHFGAGDGREVHEGLQDLLFGEIFAGQNEALFIQVLLALFQCD